MKKSRVLVFSPYPTEGASVRFRILQFIPRLEAAGYEITVHFFMSQKLYAIRRYFDLKHQLYKIGLFIWNSFLLFFRLLSIRKYDLCIVHREIFPLGPPFCEQYLKKIGVKIIYDLDDAINAKPTSGINQRFYFDKNKTKKIMAIADYIIVGNKTLAEFARGVNDISRITIVPTVIDTGYFKKSAKSKSAKKRPVVIGWVGNWGNAMYLRSIKDVFRELDKDSFILKLVGGLDIYEINFPCKIIRTLWSLEKEVKDLEELDIGIMPLVGGHYDEGKGGFKIIQYFSMGIPAVASPIGVNKEIINHETNGFLARNKCEWIDALTFLISNDSQREEMGNNARRTAEKYYSKDIAFPVIKNILQNL